MHTSAQFEGRARKGIGEMSVRSIVVLHGEMGKDFCPNFLQPFLETIHIAVTADAKSLFRYCTTLTEKADPMMPIFSSILIHLHAPIA